MPLRFFSTAQRAPHLGPYPLERLVRGAMPDLGIVPPMQPLSFRCPERPQSIINAMAEHQATLDALRDGMVNTACATIPEDPTERANHLKSFAYFCDAAMVGVASILPQMVLETPWRNPGIDRLAHELQTRQVRTLASGIDTVMADLRDSMSAPQTTAVDHSRVIVLLYEVPREMWPQEPGSDWLEGAQTHRTALLASETAVVLANYIRLLGWDAKAHTATSTDIDLGKAAVAAGVVLEHDGQLTNPFTGARLGLAAVTTTLDLAQDAPLAPMSEQTWLRTNALAWWLGKGSVKSALNRDPFARRAFAKGPHPFETLKRVDNPTTYIDAPNVARVPKRADLFARAQFGDLGKAAQEASLGGHYVRKAAPSMAQRRVLAAFGLFQDGTPAQEKAQVDPKEMSDKIKAASYFLGMDAVGISACPDWTWYSHNAQGEPIDPPHDQAISMIVDQGFETMEGASGDDWISVAQSMRAYLRFSLIGGVIAAQIRALGYNAKAHSVMDGDVLQPPLLLLSGLGEVSRIGEVILNPFLGPRLKSGVVTTDMPLGHDKPIDFGLQRFCEACNKCARECPSGAITAGPKRMFNGYEIWKSDSQKCATYRMTTKGGAMCGRCMKTCPWNLEGLFAEKPFRWAAMTIPAAAPALAKLDDVLGHGDLNPVKKWWWDLTLSEDDGGYHPTRAPVNARRLQKDLKLKFEDQTLAVYPAPLAPHPYPYPFPMDREAGIQAYKDMISAEEYQKKRAAGETGKWDHRYTGDVESPVVEVVLDQVEPLSDQVTLYTLRAAGGGLLPPWAAGAHIDVVVTPDMLRQYSLCSDPKARDHYQIAVLREDEGRGGSRMLHRIFQPGRRLFISKPINHFPLADSATHSVLMGGGIGVTPMIAMAHALHDAGESFELHYSVPTRAAGAFVNLLTDMPWSDRVSVHVSDEGTRADLLALLSQRVAGAHVYTCGPDGYMQAVLQAATTAGYPEEARHLEYFSVPDVPEYKNHPFTLVLADGRRVEVAADQSAADALIAAGAPVDLKCADGLCGVCKCTVTSGQVEHRDFVLSNAQRAHQMILCQSRAADPDGVVHIAL